VAVVLEELGQVIASSTSSPPSAPGRLQIGL
jgi:hypothetical protein